MILINWFKPWINHGKNCRFHNLDICGSPYSSLSHLASVTCTFFRNSPLAHICIQAITTKIYQTLAPLTNFPFPKVLKMVQHCIPKIYNIMRFLFMNANSLGFHLSLPTSHKLQHQCFIQTNPSMWASDLCHFH
jgi:hypothetical protein